MELFTAICNLISAFFNKSTQNTKKEISIAEITKSDTINSISAQQNQNAISQQNNTNKKLNSLISNQKIKQTNDNTKPLNQQLDDNFGSNE